MEPDDIENVSGEQHEWKTVKPTFSSSNNSKNNKSVTALNKTINGNINNNINTEFNKQNVNTVRNLITKNIKCFIILRGCSGSGKSTLANELNRQFNGLIVSADSYFIKENGNYKYDVTKIDLAHKHSKSKAEEGAKLEVSPIIVDNTNIRIWEFKDYVKMAVRYNYHIEIMEPGTPWRYKSALLCEKNVHGVPFNKIKNSLIDFERNVDLNLLIEQCKQELKESNIEIVKPKLNSCVNFNKKSKPKSSGVFLTNFNDYFNENASDWSQLTDENIQTNKNENLDMNNSNIDQLKQQQDIAENSKEQKSSFFISNKSEDENQDLIEFNQNEFDKSKEMLSQMFPNVSIDLIAEFLNKYKNEADVANILLDSLNLDEILTDNNQNTTKKQSDCQNHVIKVQSVPSLKVLCTNEMNKLETRLNDYFKSNENENLIKVCNYDLASEVEIESHSKNYEEKDFENEKYNDQNYDPILELKLDSSFLRSLVNLFGEPEDDAYLNRGQLDTHIDIKLAYEIYSSWKKTRSIIFDKSKQKIEKSTDEYSIPINDFDIDYENEKKQIENDIKLSYQIFDEINTRDPINKMPVYFSDNGVNPAANSLRQIMAEQFAEETMREKVKSFEYTSINKYDIHKSTTNEVKKETIKQNSAINDSKNIANIVKLKQLYERYDNLVDRKMLESILKDFKYNFNQACDYINCFFDLNDNDIKEPETIYNIKNTFNYKSNSENSSNLNKNNVPNYYNLNSNSNARNKLNQETEENSNRQLAKKYLNIRQAYFEKASEAYSRGWGGVAQYYAEMGHTFHINMNESNKIASTEIFLANNPDIKNSNLLDLHGLHLKEALLVLKQTLQEKKQELSSPKSKNSKTYIFVVTGYGRHSENGAKLRPNIINYLNQNKIRFKEPHIGVLKVDLTS